MTKAKLELPCDLEAERSLIGSLLLDPKHVNGVSEILEPKDFFDKQFQTIFDHLCRMTYEHEEIDVVTLRNRVAASNNGTKVTASFLADLINGQFTAANSRRYAEIVAEKAMLRRLHKLGQTIQERAISQDDPQEISNFAAAQSLALSGEVGIRSVLLSDRAVEILKPAEGIPTGYTILDETIVCLENGTLIVVAGFTGHGKSTFVTGIAVNATDKLEKRVCIVSLEMKANQQGQRVMAAKTGIDMQRIRRWDSLTEIEQQRCEGALAQDRIEYIFDTNTRPIDLRRYLDKEVPLGMGMLIIDYLQLMEPDRVRQSRELEVGDMAKSLKKTALDYNIPIIAVSQLRDPERTIQGRKQDWKKEAEPPRPHMGLLRESRVIGHTADVVIFVHRDSALTGKWIVAKQRQGPKAIIDVSFMPDTAQFVEGNVR